MSKCDHIFPVHVLRSGAGWAVRREGQKKDLSRHQTEEEAIAAARLLARSDHVEVVVHDPKGTVIRRECPLLAPS
jgi:hypothetical protein